MSFQKRKTPFLVYGNRNSYFFSCQIKSMQFLYCSLDKVQHRTCSDQNATLPATITVFLELLIEGFLAESLSICRVAVSLLGADFDHDVATLILADGTYGEALIRGAYSQQGFVLSSSTWGVCSIARPLSTKFALNP